MNEKIADIFEKLSEEYLNDEYRKRAYQKAALNIRNYPKIITSGSQAKKNIPGVGESIANKIDEILERGTLKLLEEKSQKNIEKKEVLDRFLKIYGVGPNTAEKWYTKFGWRNLGDINTEVLTSAQKIGLKYYSDLQKRIPRQEINRFKDYLVENWKPLGLIYGENHVKFKRFEITGSYRRGEETSGDIDIVVEDGFDITDLLKPLRQDEIILGDLALGTTKYMGIIKGENGTARRFDIRLVNSESYIYTLLYFTGSKELNIAMRARANDLGLTLNEYSLFNKDKKYEVTREEEIFNILGLEYIPPEKRGANFKFEEIFGKWYTSKDFSVFIHKDVKTIGRIAAFALHDSQFYIQNREILSSYIRKNYNIVFFSNKNIQKEYGSFIKNLSLPIILIININNRSNKTTWKILKKIIPKINEAFYVGRLGSIIESEIGTKIESTNIGDISNRSDKSDLIFAEDVGIKFYSLSEIFK